MRIPFTARGHHGVISVRVEPNTDPTASGHGLVVPEVDGFHGFPICTASLTFDGRGITAIFGWIQVVTNGPDVTVDLLPNLDRTDPFYTYGYLPTFFDAPANPNHPDGTWRADTFLVLVPDVIRSHAIKPVAAFTWGYNLTSGHPTLLPPHPLPPTNWSNHRPLLEQSHPTWTFT
ncbi:hypothetical protein [Kribbella sp. NPDC004875]|uniref:hypothetical protein n=1 Tax=Kribbella sp. NPDC004875 TaxID=3364107 RepID=UPI00367484B7